MSEAAPPHGDPAAPPPRVRPLALGLLLYEDRLLFAEGRDPVKGETFYRALGGEIEFGERGAEAVVRELREELGRGVRVRVALGCVENRFTYRGRPGHELVLEYVVEFAPGEEPADLVPVAAREGDAVFTARWLPLAEVIAGAHRVYPEGLPQRLADWVNASGAD